MKIVAKEDTSIGANSLVRRELMEKLAIELANILNEVHDKKLSLRFWKILLETYLNAAISSKQLFETEEIQTSPNIVAINSFKPLTFKEKARADLVRYIKYAKTFGDSKKIKEILASNNNLTLGFSQLDIIEKELGINLPTNYPLFAGSGNTKSRNKVNKIAEKYSDLFYKNLIRQIPKIYVEYFDSLYDSISLINPKEKKFHIHVLETDYMRYLVGKYIENGAKLYWYQHGGCYGEYSTHNSHYNESKLADEYRTWGWKIMDNDVPWKAYRLEVFKQKYDKEKIEKEYDCMLCYTNVYEGNIDWMVSITDTLLNKTNANKYKSFIARPRPMSRTKSHAGELSFIKDSRVDIDSGLSSMAKLIKESRVVIQFEVPCTNFLECIYVDHPTIGFLFNKTPTEPIKPYYDFFLEQGVLHWSFDSIVEHLNKVDIETWWNGLIQHPMYISFKDTFTKKV